jgi:hypothetical protein
MFSLVITNFWQKVNDVALTRYSTMGLHFGGDISSKDIWFKYSQVFMLLVFLFQAWIIIIIFYLM